MDAASSQRLTAHKIEQGLPLAQRKALTIDAARRRHLSWGMDFDSRALTLSEEINDNWDEEVKALHRENLANARRHFAAEFGELALEAKIANFVAIGTKPFSVLAHHNAFFDQVRRAFVVGAYYPSLVGACALAERILNHLILDLRNFYSHTSEYKRVHRKRSFDDWRLPLEVLQSWDVLVPKATENFKMLMPIRHKSIHFNTETYVNLSADPRRMDS